MRNVKDADFGPHREVLGRDARVPQWHLETRELGKPAFLPVVLVKWSLFQAVCNGKRTLYLSGGANLVSLISFTPVRTPRMDCEFDLPSLIDRLVGADLKDGDVLVISSKFVAISEGRIVSLASVKPTGGARELAAKYGFPASLCELILRESDEIVGGVPGFLLAIRDGLITPNAGIDKSNIEHGRVVLYPRNPHQSAEFVRAILKFRRGAAVGVVISDSRLMPTRRGTTGVALACSGLEGIVDLRGKGDLFGNILRVTSQAIADDLGSAAQLIMGESDERMPIVLVRGLETLARGGEYGSRDFAISSEECVYMRSLGYKPKRKNRQLS